MVVQSVNQNGQAITGYWAVLYNSAGTQLTTGFTPVTFSGLTAGTAYGVSVSSYGACTFSHWQDNGSTNAMRAFTAASTQTFTGVFNCTNDHRCGRIADGCERLGTCRRSSPPSSRAPP